MNTIKSIGIVGHGRFGKLLESLLKKIRPSIDLKMYSRNISPDSKRFFSVNDTVQCDLIIVAISIRAFEKVVKRIAKKFKEDSIVMDVCSVKVYPVNVMEKYLPQSITIIGSHPLFGPQTVKKFNDKLSGLKLAMTFVRGERNKYEKVKKIFENLNLKIIEMSAKDHDKFAAKSQFPAHIIGSIAAGIRLSSQPTDTKSNEVLNSFLEMIQVDPTLLHDMYRYNSNCKKELQKIKNSFESVIKML